MIPNQERDEYGRYMADPSVKPQVPFPREPDGQRETATGRFAKGNQLSKGRAAGVTRFNDLRSALLNCFDADVMRQLTMRLIDIGLNGTDSEATKAIVHIWERLYGKPHVTAQVQTQQVDAYPTIEMSPEEAQVAERMLNRMKDQLALPPADEVG
jgi:hypothetical protein